jgi:hypothetical protein
MTEKEKDKNLIVLDAYEVSFRIPERITVRTALEYWSIVTSSLMSPHRILRQWEACTSCGLVEDWKCERFPDPTVSLEDVPAEDERYVAGLIMAATSHVQAHMNEIRSVEKN